MKTTIFAVALFGITWAAPVLAAEQCKPASIHGNSDLYFDLGGAGASCSIITAGRRFSGTCTSGFGETKRVAGDLRLKRSCLFEGRFDTGGGIIRGTMQVDGQAGAGLFEYPDTDVQTDFTLVRRP